MTPYEIGQKIAKETAAVEKNRDPNYDWGDATIDTGKALLANTIGTTALGAPLIPLMGNSNVNPHTYARHTENVAKKMNVKNVGINVDPNRPFMANNNTTFDPRNTPWSNPNLEGVGSSINIPSGAHDSILAHELGHSKNQEYLDILGKKLNMGRAGKSILKGFTGVSGNKLAPLSTLGSTVAAFNQDDPTYTPGLINAGVHAPRLLDEAMASGHAAKYLIGQHGLGKGLLKSLPLLPAFGTYAAGAALPSLITAYRKHKLQKKADWEAPAQKLLQTSPMSRNEFREHVGDVPPLEPTVASRPGSFPKTTPPPLPASRDWASIGPRTGSPPVALGQQQLRVMPEGAIHEALNFRPGLKTLVLPKISPATDSIATAVGRLKQLVQRGL